jgi:hypothetical protein
LTTGKKGVVANPKCKSVNFSKCFQEEVNKMDKDKNKSGEGQLNVNVNFDTTPIVYTDSIQFTTNEDGVVFDVMQRLMSSNQVRIVSRIGMSRNHAKKLVAELGRLLALTEGQGKTSVKKN